MDNLSALISQHRSQKIEIRSSRFLGVEKGRRMTQILRLTLGYFRFLKRLEKTEGLPRPLLHGYMQLWARQMLDILRFNVSQEGEPLTEKPAIYVGNHVSYLDIPLLMSLAPVVFIAKKQLAKWPIFGAAATLVGTVYVDRDSKNSRQNAGDAIAPWIRNHGQSVTVFPSGTTSMHQERDWRWGIFRIAQEAGIPVQPFRIRYQPMRRAAYLMEDMFFVHLWNILDGQGIEARVEFQPPVMIQNVEADSKRLHDWASEGLEKPPVVAVHK